MQRAKICCARPPRLCIDFHRSVTFNFHSQFLNRLYYKEQCLILLKFYRSLYNILKFLHVKFHINRTTYSGEILYQTLV